MCQRFQKTFKHTIDVVVDRFKVRDDLGNRVAESLRPPLRLGSDIAILHDMDAEFEDKILSAKHICCPVCDRSVAELEPKLFSFNNPYGACPRVCDGLGKRQYFAAEKSSVILKIAQPRAIQGWDKRHAYYFGLLTTVAEHYGIDMGSALATTG